MRFPRLTVPIVFAACFLCVPFASAADVERLLLPIFTPPVFGAHGSEFRTSLTLHNESDRNITVFGVREECEVCIPDETSGSSVDLAPGGTFTPRYNGTPGRFIQVAAGDFDELAANLRVYDVSHDAQNFGTELPIVRERELKNAPILLAGVPVANRFRNTLRIYGTKAGNVRVTIGTEITVLALVSGPDEFDPAYAVFTDFPYVSGESPTVRITITPLDDSEDAARIWAFVSATNNDTQMITTVTPQR